MSELANSIAYRRLRAPREDGQALFEPPVADEAAFLRQNIAIQARMDCDIHGQTLGQLRMTARQELLRQAHCYTRQYRNVPAGERDPHAPIILMGHQPELVHPGVWFKNFLLSELAQRTSAHAVNLLIDNDSLRSTSVRVPGGSVQDPIVSSIAIDASAPPIPYESRSIIDPALFSHFGQRVAKTIAPLIKNPIINQFWPTAVEAAHQHNNLGRALAQARHKLEGQWGLESLELPLSAMCDTTSFRWFAAHLLANAPQLRETHNACLAEYRRANKVRNHAHPIPDLGSDDDWTETPFWLWSAKQPHRHAAFARRSAGQVVLSDRKSIHINLDLPRDADANRCVDQLEEATRQGVRLRPRALITTMFARLVLGDIFIHGIGGAKYDEVTDAMVRRFFAVEPPEYLVATATLKLPIRHASVDPRDIQRVKQQLRELRYHGELHVDDTPQTRALIAEKHRWIAVNRPAERLHERHEGIERVNNALRAMLGARQEQLSTELVELRSLLHKQAIFESREYAFCLFPLESLRDRLLDLSRQ